MEDQSYDADDIDDSFPEGTENGDPMPKKRRRRAVLSCTACKLRKIKCSRTFPCTACVGRGSADVLSVQYLFVYAVLTMCYRLVTGRT